VLGAGGLGHVAIQLIKHLTPATVVALDVQDHALDLAREVGADFVFKSNADAVQAVMDITHGKGAEVVFDFVGIQATADLGAKLTHVLGDWIIVGIGGGIAKAGFGAIPYETSVLSPYWGTRGDLMDVVALAQRGVIDIHTETYPLDEAPEAYDRLREGKIIGRAVLVP
jgi:propanol-preferring alcohol dehydrogenase